jgi:hypothetical protein
MEKTRFQQIRAPRISVITGRSDFATLNQMALFRMFTPGRRFDRETLASIELINAPAA